MSTTPNRKLWRPKLPEVPAQCASCPFLNGNDAEFGAIVTKLRNSLGFKGEAHPFDVLYARRQIKRDLQFSGDFICHHTAYDERMRQRPITDGRQCKGATKWYRNGGDR